MIKYVILNEKKLPSKLEIEIRLINEEMNKKNNKLEKEPIALVLTY